MVQTSLNFAQFTLRFKGKKKTLSLFPPYQTNSNSAFNLKILTGGE